MIKSLILKLKNNRKLLFILGGLAGIIILALANLLPSKPISLITTVPENNQYHNPHQPITLTFNRRVSPKSIQATLAPTLEFDVLRGDKNTILVQPKTKLEPETQYQLILTSPVQHTLTFQTDIEAGQLENWNQLFNQQAEEYQKLHGVQNNALTQIRRNSPISQQGFIINYSYKTSTYTIILSPPYDQTKTQAIDWLNSEGITNFDLMRLNWIEK